jgi:ketose-bisphosphate aldolase
MPLVSFHELMARAEEGGYAVGYFESWNLESLQGVIDAAEASNSPVIVGFSGLQLPDPQRQLPERLELYAALGKAACDTTRVPCCLVFNESPSLPWVERAIRLGFNLVMFADEQLAAAELTDRVKQTVRAASGRAAVEAEMAALPGVARGLERPPETIELTNPCAACKFVDDTGVDALAVSLGNVHLHGREKVELDIDRLSAIRRAVNVPLVLHGATSVHDTALRSVIREGIRKINVGSALRTAFFNAVRERLIETGSNFNPYEVLGSGLAPDILSVGRRAVRDVVCDKMTLFGSAGRA